MSDTQPKVGLLLCEHLRQGPSPQKSAVEGIEQKFVTDLCSRPEMVTSSIEGCGFKRLVIGICHDAAPWHEYQKEVRSNGIDPYAFELVGLDRSDSERAAILLKAAVARQRAYRSGGTDTFKMKLMLAEGKRSRRSLLSVPPFIYSPVPQIDAECCLGGRKCGLCVTACPFDALSSGDPVPDLDRGLCESCGLCVTACPTAAVGLAGSSLEQIGAGLQVLLKSETPLILFHCQGSRKAVEETFGTDGQIDKWLPFELPALGMVTCGWMLGLITAGAASVALFECGAECECKDSEAVGNSVAYAQDFLAAAGIDGAESRVLLLSGGPHETNEQMLKLQANPPVRLESRGTTLPLTEPAATVAAVRSLAGGAAAEEGLVLEHEASPLGVISVNRESCTLCGSCATACPTSAIELDEGREGSKLSFSAEMCIACSRCERVCPEPDTLSMWPVTDVKALSLGRIMLKEGQVALCKRCGRPIAPAAMLQHVRGILEQDDGSEKLVEAISDHCLNCR